MSENQNRSLRDFSKYDELETQELEAILRLDAESPEGQESDTEKILYVMEVLASRANANNTGNTTLEAWESFQKNYLPMEEDSVEYTPKTQKTVQPWVRRLTAAAAVIVLLIGISATAVSAFGWEDIWNAVAKWAKETFSFVSNSDAELTEPEERTAQEYTSLQDALRETDQDGDFIPTWIPDGYQLDDITVDENPMQRVYAAKYISGEKELIITVRSYLEIDPEKVEIDDALLEIYEKSGTEYYIFKNDLRLHAVWIKGSYECYISGELTVEEIKTMIDSIGKG